MLLKLIQPRFEKTKNAIMFKGSNLWNSLSTKHQRANNYESFKLITKKEITK